MFTVTYGICKAENYNEEGSFRGDNLIERRLFPNIARSCSGMLFDTIDRVVELMSRTSTTTGLRTRVNVIRRFDVTKRNATSEMKSQLRILYYTCLSKWNYVARPEISQ